MTKVVGERVSTDEAIQQINNWLNLRKSLSFVQSFLCTPHHFVISSDFKPDVFNIANAHAYFGINIVTDNPEQLQFEPSLLFIPAYQDATDYADERYIYKASYIKEGTEVVNETEQKGAITPEEAIDLVSNWSAKSVEWTEFMVDESKDGMTLAFDVPWRDLKSHFKEEHGLTVRLGLHNHVNPALNPALLFFDGATNAFVDLFADDVTTPKPPFGNQAASSYALVGNFFNQ